MTLNSVTDVGVAGYDCPNEDDATVVCEIHLSDRRQDSAAVADDLFEVVVVGELLMSYSKLSLNRYYHVADDRESGESVAVAAVVQGDDDDVADEEEEAEGDGEQLRCYVVIDDDGEQ